MSRPADASTHAEFVEAIIVYFESSGLNHVKFQLFVAVLP